MPSNEDGDKSVLMRIDGAVAHVLIDRAEARNALSTGALAGLDAAIDTAESAGCSVFVLRGAGGTLSAGADLKHLRSVLDDPVRLRDYVISLGRVMDRLEAASFVSVAVVDGYAVASGCEILLACDLAVVSERSMVGDRHLEYGLLPGAGGSVRLTQALPRAFARRLLYTGELIDGATAHRLGLVSHAVPADELESTVDSLVARLARPGPDTLKGMKRLHTAACEIPREIALEQEREALLEHLDGPIAREGLAAFAQRREPRFAAARPDGG